MHGFEGGGTRVLDVVPTSPSGSSLAKISGLVSSCISTRELSLSRMPDANAYAMAVHSRVHVPVCTYVIGVQISLDLALLVCIYIYI